MRTQIQELILRGDYRKAIEIIEKHKIPTFYPHKVEILNLMTMYHQIISEFEPISEFYQKLPIFNSQKSFESLIHDDSIQSVLSQLISLGSALINLGQEELADECIHKINSLFPIDWIKTPFDANNNTNTDPLVSLPAIQLRINRLLGNYYYEKNNTDVSMQFYHTGLELANKYNLMLYKTLFNIDLGKSRGLQGAIETAIEHNQIALNYAKELENPEILTISLGWLATWKFMEFKLVEMEHFLHEILGYSGKLVNQQSLIFAYIYLSQLYNLRGNMQLAEDYITTALEMVETTENKVYFALAKFYAGIIQRSLKNYKISVHYLREAIASRKESGFDSEQNAISLANIYYHQIITLIDIGAYSEVENIRDQLKKLAEKYQNQLIVMIWRIADALILKNSESLVKKAQAITIFEDLQTLPIFDTSRFISIFALFHYFDLLLDELKLSVNSITLKKANNALRDLTKVAEEQELNTLKAEVLLLNVRFSALQGHYSEAKGFLERATVIAKDLMINQMIDKVEYENEKLSSQIIKILDVIDINKDIFETTRVDELQDYLSSINDIIKRV